MHVGIIMDGNGRWANNRSLPRAFGHRRGASRVSEIIKACPKYNIQTLTLYAFSTENWNRAAHEVESLMRLFRGYLQSKYLQIIENNIKVTFLGDTNPIPKDILLQMRQLEDSTNKNDGFFLNIAINYGGRDEIIRAVRKIYQEIDDKKFNSNDINSRLFANYLDTAGQKDPDLIIRTAGERRLSNFLLWQTSYSELYFTDEMWPDFSQSSLKIAIDWYNSRVRKYGTVNNEMHNQ